MIEFDKLSKDELARDQAVAMALWFEDYLFGLTDEPGELPSITVDRLDRQFGNGDRNAQLECFKDYLVGLEADYQAVFALYMCGYSEEDIEALSGSPSRIVIARLDRDIPPYVARRAWSDISSRDRFAWQSEAECLNRGTDLFFSMDGMRGKKLREFEASAKQICASCKVIDQCKDYALTTREPYGVWGGLGINEREAILRRAKTAQAS
jgi:WhiB family redox-sensing transcriptional regulator